MSRLSPRLSQAGDGEFHELLDIWFPEKQPLPTAFLVDTSEEALLLPDWLKLRMIRSEVPRLVDAGMARLGLGGQKSVLGKIRGWGLEGRRKGVRGLCNGP
jgi:hypothetical protein